MTWSGVRLLLKTFLDEQTGIRTVTRRPADLASVLPINEVTILGGASDSNNWKFRAPRVDIGSFAATDEDAELQAQQVEDLIRGVLPGMIIGDSVVTRTDTAGRPSWRPYANTNVFYFGAMYQVWLKAK